MATITTRRPWEDATSAPRGQLPSITALTKSLPTGPGSSAQQSPTSIPERDSGAWSSQPQSTRSSAYSSGTNGYTNSAYTSPQRVSSSSQFGATSHPFEYSNGPNSAGAQPSPGFSSLPQGSGLLPSLNQHHDPSAPSSEFPPQESRRSSLGSQVNQGMNGLDINGSNSPYPSSINHSSVSLAQNLSRERGIANGTNGARNSRSSGGVSISPLSPQPSEPRMPFVGPRIAPPIGHNPRSEVYNAEKPIPGQAYAFPDPLDMRPGDLPPTPGQRASNSGEIVRPDTYNRRDSGHTSIASSNVASESRLPMGQRRLDEGDMPITHHHSLQHRQLTDLTDGSETVAEGMTPYSRTPALRVSHKMAERKRRSEMKDLFENLRSQIPSSAGSKSSKWEILTKATEHIKVLEHTTQTANQNCQQSDEQLRAACHDLEMARREAEHLRNENQRLAHEIALYRQQVPTSQPPPPPPPQSNKIFSAEPPRFGTSTGPMMTDSSRSLPPLTNNTAAPSLMQGIQYSHDRR